VTGWSVQALSFVCLFLAGARFHQNLVPLKDYRVTNLVAYEPLVLQEPRPVNPPALARHKPLKREPTVEKAALESKPAVAAFVVTPQVKAIPEHKLPETEFTAPALRVDSKMPVIPSAPTSQVVAVGTFSHDGPVTAPVARLATVQAAGFGNSNGNGSGHGIGMGTTSPNVVASSGFGNGAIDALNTGVHRKVGWPQPSTGADAPVEITFKPKPGYTDEGRKQKINGEVRLQVMFSANGRVHVVRVVQGLGYGLDEQAVKAAEQIKFKPALREGQPIDSMALVHIIFELIS
jgi:TonB family protein